MSEPSPTIDELLDRAIQAINSGDRATASALAEQVLHVDSVNKDAEDLLSAPTSVSDELRRLTVLFADMVDSTALSGRIEPETYYTVIERYRRQVNEIVDRYEGHVFSTKGDGLLAVFGHPKAHENDVRRAVQAGLDITREVSELSARVRARFGFDIEVRVGVHRGLVYLDIGNDDVYGLGANLASRVCGLAPPGTVVVSAAIAPLVRDHFDLQLRPAQQVKGIDEPVEHFQVIGERVSPARRPLHPLVGRERELAHLRASWELAGSGALTDAGVAFVGEAGIGKSRLATAAAALAGPTGAPVLALIGSPFHADAGLFPIRALLEQNCGIERTTEQAQRLRLLEDQVRARGLSPESAVPLLAPVLGVAAEHGYPPVRAEGAKLYRQIVKTVVGYLLACAGTGPAVLLAEDMQWFDTSTLDVVKALLAADTGRLLVVLTARDLGRLSELAPLEVFHLTPLSAAETDQLVTALDPTLSADERAAVGRRCGGVPLYIEEVVAKVHEQPTDQARSARVPDALYEPLFSRLRASDTTIQVVEAAATIGREFDATMLRRIVEMSQSDLDDAIRQLETSLVFESTGLGCWRFRHELLREVAYELPPPSTRRTLHGKVADALVGDTEHPDWHLVALHYEHAERLDEAADAHQQAAIDARHRGALDEARACLTRAIAQIERGTSDPVHDRREAKLRLRRGFLASAAGGTASAQAAADFERCLQLAGTLRETDLVATLTALWAYYLPRGDVHRALQVSESLRDTSLHGRPWSRASNEGAFGMVAWFRGDFGRARELLEAATAAAAAATASDYESVWYIPNDPIASMHTHLALARFVQGDPAGADAQLAETACRVAVLGFPQGPFSLAYERSFEIWMRIEAGQLDRADATVAELSTDARRHGFDFWSMIAVAQRATVDALSALSGRDIGPAEPATLAAHIETMSMVVSGWRQVEAKLFVTFYDGVLARLLIAAGRPAEARAALAAALDLAEETGVNFYRAELLRLRAAAAPDADARDADLGAALDTARTQGALIFELRSAMDGFEAHGDSASGALRDAVGRFPTDSSWPELVRARTLLR